VAYSTQAAAIRQRQGMSKLQLKHLISDLQRTTKPAEIKETGVQCNESSLFAT